MRSESGQQMLRLFSHIIETYKRHNIKNQGRLNDIVVLTAP